MDNKLIVRKLTAHGEVPSVIQLSGPIILTTLFGFQDATRGDSADTLILDMTEVPYIDSAGIGSLVNSHVSRMNAGRKLVLVGVAERVTMILTVTGVDKVFSVFPTLEAAQESLRQAATS